MASTSANSNGMEVASIEQPSTSRKDEEEEKTMDEQTQFELLHAIERFLEGGKFDEAAAALRREIDLKKLVPIRTDIKGANHEQSYNQFLSAQSSLPSNSHLTEKTLPAMITRLSTLSNRDVAPPVKGLKLRLITNKRNALQRSNDVLLPPRRADVLLARRDRVNTPKTRHPPIEYLRIRELGYRVPASLLPDEKSIELIERHIRIQGHLSAAYSVIFDQTENYVLTGADDGLIKVWSLHLATLRFTYRGHMAEIMDMSVSYCNQLIASGSRDRDLRVWRLDNGETVAVFKHHTAAITSVQFLPFTGNGSLRYLVSTANDCKVNFYSFYEDSLLFPAVVGEDQFGYRHMERDMNGAKMISSAFSPSGHIVVTGESHGLCRVYRVLGLDGGIRKMADIEAHTNRVDNLVWSHTDSLRFASGSSDGTAKIWKFQFGEWEQTVLALSQDELIRICGLNVLQNNPNSKNKYQIQELCWTSDDSRIITHGSDHSYRVWDPKGTQLLKLSVHSNDAYLLRPHPLYPHIVLSSGYDGSIKMTDVVRGGVLCTWENKVEHGEMSSIFDIVLSKDGSKIAASDNKGQFSLYGLGTNKTKYHKEQFFSTDYDALEHDDAGWALDVRTNLAPHLMPPPYLVMVGEKKYPLSAQAQVPGREERVNLLIEKREKEGDQPVDDFTDYEKEVLEDPLTECPWLRRKIVPPLSENERKTWAERQSILCEMESNEFDAELRRERPPSAPEIEAIVHLSNREKARAARPTNFRTAFGLEGAMAQARSRESQQRIAMQAQRLAIRRGISIRSAYLGAENDRNVALALADLEDEDDDDLSESVDSEYTSDSDFETEEERRAREQREREREVTSTGGTASRPRRREREVEEEEGMDESSQHSRPERRTARRRAVDPFGEDLSIDMYDQPSTSTGRTRSRREGTQERPSNGNSKRRRNISDGDESNEEVEEEEEEPEVEDTVVREERRTVRRAPNAKDAWKFSFPDWMRDVKRKRFPYIAQIGDHVVYFRQGHEHYLNEVERTKLYPIDHRMQPTPDIAWEEFAIVEDVKYVLKPYRLTQVKLGKTDSEGRRTGHIFTVKVHDMDNVPDFIILRAFYDEGLAMNLDVGDGIEAAIDDIWWSGTVENINRNTAYPNAQWQCLGVRYLSGEDGDLSPWDLRKNQTARRTGNSVTEEEVIAMGSVSYGDGDWPEGDHNGEATRERIKRALVELGECETASVFNLPVPLQDYTDYPSKVPYPADLQTICERIDNQYYRRLLSLLQDIRYIALSAEAYNQKSSIIVRNAKVLVQTIVEYANDPSIDNVVSFYDTRHDLSDAQLVEYRRRPKPEVNSEMLEMLLEEESARGNEKAGQPARPGWIKDTVDVLENLMQQQCARHFVNKDASNQELADTWDNCNDLRTLCTMVRNGEMPSPKEVEKEVHSLVTTAKNCIENRRSEVYKDLLSLHSLFDCRFKSVLSKFESFQASVQSQLGISLGRSRRTRARDVPQHAYNTRRADQSAIAAAVEYEEEGASSSRAAARHERGFYRSMVNGRSQEREERPSTSGRRSGRSAARDEGEGEGWRMHSIGGVRIKPSVRRAAVAAVEEEERDEEVEEREEEEEEEEAVVPVDMAGSEDEEEDNGEEEDAVDSSDEEYAASPSKKGRRTSKRGRRTGSTEDEESATASTSTSTSSTRRSARKKPRRSRISSHEEEEDDEEEEGSWRRGRRRESRRPTRASTRHSQQTYDERSEEDEEEVRVTPSISQRGRHIRLRTFAD